MTPKIDFDQHLLHEVFKVKEHVEIKSFPPFDLQTWYFAQERFT
jgi:hypothetical protein